MGGQLIDDWLLEQIRTLLGIPVLEECLNKTFTELGGNSLLAVRLAASCRRGNVILSVESILSGANIGALLNCAILATPEDELPPSCVPNEDSLSDGSSEVESMDTLGSDMSLDSSSESGKGTLATEMQLALIHGTQRFPSHNTINYFETHPSSRLPVLHHAWRTVICMESIFRTKFDLRNGGQMIEQPEVPFVWTETTVTDRKSYQHALRHGASLFESRQTDEDCDFMIGNKFDVVTLHDEDNDVHISTVIWRVHHALVDGHSAILVLEKVRRVSSGLPVQQGPSFKAVAASLRQVQTSSTAVAKQFWQERYAAHPTASSQLLFQSPQDASGTPQEVLFQIPTDINMLAQHNGVTVATLCYAAWALTLTLFTDSDTVVFGSVMSGRNLSVPNIDQAIGPVVNTLPMHVKIDRDHSTQQFLQVIFRQLVELSSFQWSLPEHGYNRHFASALSMQFDIGNVGNDQMLTPIERPYSLSETDIPISIFIETDGTIRMQYNSSAFHPYDMQTLADHYRQAFCLLAQPTTTRIDQCLKSLLTSEACHSVRTMGNWDSPQTRLPSVREDLTSLFEYAVSQNPSHVAVEKGDMRLTYSQLKVAAGKVARKLTSFTNPGDVVCLHADRSIGWICGIYGILLAGAVYCPIDPSLPQALRESHYRTADAKVFLMPVNSHFNVRPESCSTLISVEEILNDPDAREIIPRNSGPDPQAAAYICFTSGSTGKPKGVVCNHSSLVAFQTDLTVRLMARPGWKVAQIMSVAFDGSIHEIFSTLSYGATLVLPHSADPFAHLDRVDSCVLTPSIAKILDFTQFLSLSTVYLVGEPVPAEVNNRLAMEKTAYNMYGPTEGTGGATIKRLLPGHPVTIGSPNPSTRIYIMNREMSLVPPGVVGEICLAGVQVARGYIGLPIESAERFLADPVCQDPGETVYRTGDHGYWDVSSQEVVCLGRKDRMVKLRGFRLDLNDLEVRVLRAGREVSTVAISAAKDYLVALITPASIDTVSLMSRVRNALPPHAVPKYILAADRLPMTSAGKLDYKAVANALPACQPTRSLPVKPLTPTEARVARMWRAILSLGQNTPIERSSNFFDLGGHSILQLHLATALNDEFPCRIPVRLVLECPTLLEMADTIDRLIRQNGSTGKDSIISKRSVDEQELAPIELDWWHKYQLNEGSSAFNVCFAVRFDPSRMDRQLLTAAWNTVLMRHRILRCRYVRTRRLGVRRQYADCPPQVERLDQLSLWNEINRPFQLERNNPIRVMMSRDVLLIVISHIVCDLTALRLLNQEVMHLYRGEPLSGMNHRYMHVVAQNTMTAPCDLDFWTKYLSDQPGSETSFEVQSDRTSYRGSSVLVDIPPRTFERTLDLIAVQHLTLHQLALAAVALTMQVDRNPIDIVLGGPHLNRKTSEAQRTVGLFLEPLPIRIKSGAQDVASVSEFLQSVKQSSQQALGHAVPWNHLLRHLGTVLDYPNHPLFDIMVTFHDDRHDPSVPLTGSQRIPIWAQGSKFKLMFEFSASSDGRVVLRIEHDQQCYPRAVVHHIASLLLKALELLGTEASYRSLRTELQASYHCK